MTTIDLTVMTFDAAKALFVEIRAAQDNWQELVIKAHDGKAWAAIGYNSWAECVRQEFPISKRHANRLIQYGKVYEVLADVSGTNGPLLESHARELATLEPEQQREAYVAAVEASGGKPEAAHVKAAVAKVRAKRNGTAAQPEPPPHAPEPGPGEAPFDPDDDKNGLVYCNGVRWRVDATPEDRREIMRNNWEDWDDEERGYFLDGIITNFRPLFIAAIARAK